jgi:glutaredoxin 3
MTLVIYTMAGCPYCVLAKQHLTDHGVGYTELVYDDYQQRQRLYDELGLFGNQRTLPQIFQEQAGHRTRIGGYDDLLHSEILIGFNEEF